MSVIEVRDLSKHYGDVRAVDGISFEVEAGEVFGYLGPNGAGKTTTIRTLLGLLAPTAGSASVLGADCTDERSLIEARRAVGYLPANPSFDEDATGREVLDLHGSIKGDERLEELLELFDPPLDRRVRDYSTGNEQKLGLIQAFMHGPKLVILDEPTSGLDPLMQQRFNEFVRAERDRGTTVFFSSHVLSEVRQVCDRVAILRDGAVVATERIESLLGRSGKFVRARLLGDVPAGALDGDAVHDYEQQVVERGHSDVATDGRTAPPNGAAEAQDRSDSSEPVTEAQDQSDSSEPVTEVRFTYTGDINDLLEELSGYRYLDLDVEEAPLEEVFMGFYGDAAAAASGPGGAGGSADV